MNEREKLTVNGPTVMLCQIRTENPFTVAQSSVSEVQLDQVSYSRKIWNLYTTLGP